MKSIFFYLLALSVPLILGGGFVYLVWHAISSLFSDWQLKQELEELRVEAAALREHKRSKTAQEEVTQNDTSDSDLHQPLDVGDLDESPLDEIMKDQPARSEPKVPVADTKSPSVSLDSAPSLVSELPRPQAEPSVADSAVEDPVESENSAADVSEAATGEKTAEALEQNTKTESNQDVASPAIQSPTGSPGSDRTESTKVQKNPEKLAESTSQNESVEREAPPEEHSQQRLEDSPQNLAETRESERIQPDEQNSDHLPPVEKPEG